MKDLILLIVGFLLILRPRFSQCNHASERWKWNEDERSVTADSSSFFGRSIGDEEDHSRHLRHSDDGDVIFPNENGRIIYQTVREDTDFDSGIIFNESLLPRTANSDISAVESNHEKLQPSSLLFLHLNQRLSKNKSKKNEEALSGRRLTEQQLQNIEIQKTKNKENPIRSVALVVPADMSKLPLESSGEPTTRDFNVVTRRENSIKTASGSSSFTFGPPLRNLNSQRHPFNQQGKTRHVKPALFQNSIQITSKPAFHPSPLIKLSNVRNVNPQISTSLKKNEVQVPLHKKLSESLMTINTNKRSSLPASNSEDSKDFIYLIGLTEENLSKLPMTLENILTSDIKIKKIQANRGVRSEQQIGFGLPNYELPQQSSGSGENKDNPVRIPGRVEPDLYLIPNPIEYSNTVDDSEINSVEGERVINSAQNNQIIALRPSRIYSSIPPVNINSEENRFSIYSSLGSRKEQISSNPQRFGNSYRFRPTVYVNKENSNEVRQEAISLTRPQAANIYSGSREFQEKRFQTNRPTYYSPTLTHSSKTFTSHGRPVIYNPPRRPKTFTRPNIESFSVEEAISSTKSSEEPLYTQEIPKQVFSEENRRKTSELTIPSFKIEDDVTSTYHNPLRIEVIQGDGVSQDTVVNGQLTSIYEGPIRVIVHKRGGHGREVLTLIEKAAILGARPSSNPSRKVFSDSGSSESIERPSYSALSSVPPRRPVVLGGHKKVGTQLDVNVPSRFALPLPNRGVLRGGNSDESTFTDHPSNLAYLHRGSRTGLYTPKAWVWPN